MIIHMMLIKLINLNKRCNNNRCENLRLILSIFIYPHLYDIRILIFIYSKYSCLDG